MGHSSFRGGSGGKSLAGVFSSVTVVFLLSWVLQQIPVKKFLVLLVGCPPGRSAGETACGAASLCGCRQWNRSLTLSGSEMSLQSRFIVGLQFY